MVFSRCCRAEFESCFLLLLLHLGLLRMFFKTSTSQGWSRPKARDLAKECRLQLLFFLGWPLCCLPVASCSHPPPHSLSDVPSIQHILPTPVQIECMLPSYSHLRSFSKCVLSAITKDMEHSGSLTFRGAAEDAQFCVDVSRVKNVWQLSWSQPLELGSEVGE